MDQVIGWWSAGVTSAIAILKAIEQGHNVVPIYFETGSHHPDNQRFKLDCERLYGRKIITFQNRKYDSVLGLLEKITYVNGPGGAECTRSLKKDVRLAIEKWMPYSAQIFGFEFEPKEIKRAQRFTEQYPTALAMYPLIDAKLTKANCLHVLETNGIRRPTMYEMGYQNNNCIGCVKGGMGYWNKIRVDFPDVFERTSRLEQSKGHSCIKGVFLKDLDPSRGNYPSEITAECGVFCPTEEFTEVNG
jgi:hypothetical protein